MRLVCRVAELVSLGKKLRVSEMLETIQYAVFAAISRRLTEAERRTIFEALDANVPGSGHVGHERVSAPDEVYFVVEGLSEERAKAQADSYMKLILQVAKSDLQYAITLQKNSTFRSDECIGKKAQPGSWLIFNVIRLDL